MLHEPPKIGGFRPHVSFDLVSFSVTVCLRLRHLFDRIRVHETLLLYSGICLLPTSERCSRIALSSIKGEKRRRKEREKNGRMKGRRIIPEKYAYSAISSLFDFPFTFLFRHSRFHCFSFPRLSAKRQENLGSRCLQHIFSSVIRRERKKEPNSRANIVERTEAAADSLAVIDGTFSPVLSRSLLNSFVPGEKAIN